MKKQETKETPIISKKVRKKVLSVNPHRINIGTSIIILLLIIYLYWDSTKDPEIGDRKPVGKVTSTINNIERKLGAKVVWKSIEKEDIVYNYDSIRTYETSGTTIDLEDGTRVSLKENTIIYININQQKIDINFIQGELEVDTTNQKRAEVERINLVHGDEVVKVDKTKITVSKPAINSPVKLELKQGNAKLEKKGKEIPLNKEEVIVSKNEITKTVPSKPELTPINIQFPKNHSKIDVSKLDRFTFSWTQDKDVTTYHIQLTRMSDNLIIFEKTTKQNRYSINDFSMLKKGTYQVSVRSQDGLKRAIHTFEISLPELNIDNFEYETPEKVYVE